MATYKLIQDIEAEDKILGPLTLRQFIFAMISVFMLYLCFISVVKHVFFLLVFVLPPAVFFGFFALPFGRDQPTEVWFLAKLRFWFKPRRRVWNQSGIKELVTITVPKKVERILTDGLSQTEVNSRLQALAQTLDTRGWAVKHVASDVYTPQAVSGGPDRLLSFDSLPQEVPNVDTIHTDDMLDETTSPIARQFDTMINQSSQVRRQELMDQLNSAAYTPAGVSPATIQATSSPWFMGQPHVDPPGPPFEPTATGNVQSAPDDSNLSAQLASRANSRQVSLGNLRTVRPGGAQAPPSPVPDSSYYNPADSVGPAMAAPMTVPDDPAILSLARNDDLDVATLARQAKKNRPNTRQSLDEVVIPLH